MAAKYLRNNIKNTTQRTFYNLSSSSLLSSSTPSSWSLSVSTSSLTASSVSPMFQAGTTTTTATHAVVPHATTVDAFTRSLWNTTIFDELQDLFRSIGYSFCHISWDTVLVCFNCFPSAIHSIERRWISTQGTVPLGNLKVCFVNILLKCFSRWWQTTQFWCCWWLSCLSVPTAAGGIPSWKSMVLCNHSMQPWNQLIVWPRRWDQPSTQLSQLTVQISDTLRFWAN